MKRMWAVACGCIRAWVWGVSYLSYLANLNVVDNQKLPRLETDI